MGTLSFIIFSACSISCWAAGVMLSGAVMPEEAASIVLAFFLVWFWFGEEGISIFLRMKVE